MDTSILEQELAPLKVQIEQVRGKIAELEGQLRSAEEEMETFSADQDRFDALRDVCDALDKLGELEAAALFWDGMPGVNDGANHIAHLRDRIVQFEGEIQRIQEKQDALKAQIYHFQGDLNELRNEVRDAYAREERRREEFVVEREVSDLPYRDIIMPWTREGESERVFRKAVLISLLASFLFGTLIPLISVPIPDRSAVVEIPERLAKLVKKEPPKPPPEKPKKEKPELDEQKPKKAEDKKVAEKPTKSEKLAARKKAESTGVLAFKSSFADLMDETPVARLGSEAKFNKKSGRAPGQARAQRSLVAMAKGTSGGIGGSSVSRNLGSGGGNSDGIGGVGFARVASSLTGLAEQEGRAVSDGIGPARTDEEIQIVFDRYKALLYRIYNKELRKDPTLRGKLLLRITIEPDGTVSKCTVESTDLASPQLVKLIVARVKRFNFSPKDGVPKTTILYPIDFLPAG